MLLLLSCAYEVPLDPDQAALGNTIAGTVIADTEGADTFVLLFAADDPPPPAGTGSPLTFASIPGDRYTGEGAGLQEAPFAVTGVPDGDWLLTALLDADGDFQPFLSSNAGATCGDWVGAHVTDLTTGDFSPVSVAGGEVLDDVPILVAREMTTERPAFVFAENIVTQTSPDTQTFTLASAPIHSSLVELTGPFDGTDACDTMFLVYVPDENADGAPDPHPEESYAAQGLPLIWPRVYVQYLGEMEEGESWASEAVIYPDFLATGEVAVGVPTPRTQISVIFVPAALHTLADGTQEVVTAPNLPTGAWSVTVVSFTGQTWALPNEVAAFPAASSVEGADFDPALQGATIQLE